MSVISSCITHFATAEGCDNVLIYRKDNATNLIPKLRKRLEDFHSVSLSKERFRLALIADRYNCSEFQAASEKLNLIARKLGYPCFDRMVYMEDLSWNFDKFRAFLPDSEPIIDDYLKSIDLDLLKN